MSNIISDQIKNNINIFLSQYFRIIIVVVVMTILLAGNLFFVWPKYKRILKDIDAANKEEDLRYAKRQKYLNQLKELKSEYQRINRDDLRKIKIMLPKKSSREELLAQTEDMIVKNGFLLTDLRVENVADKQGDNIANNKAAQEESLVKPANTVSVKKIKIIMNVVGTDYTGLKRLLKIIENNLRLMDVVNLSFNLTNRTTSLEVYTYYID